MPANASSPAHVRGAYGKRHHVRCVVVALFFFTITAVIASNLMAQVRAQAITARRQRARTTEELYQFSRKLAGAANLDHILSATVPTPAFSLHRYFNYGKVILPSCHCKAPGIAFIRRGGVDLDDVFDGLRCTHL